MPNHVRNKLTVLGEMDRVALFVERANGSHPPSGDEPGDLNHHDEPATVSPLCFHQIVPLPKEYGKVAYGDDNPRSGWNLERETWGTKWGSYSVDGPVIGSRGATYTFQTAWCCPRKWLAGAASFWDDLVFVCSYGGDGPVRGQVVYRHGTCVHDRDDDWYSVMQPEYTLLGYDDIEDEDEMDKISTSVTDKLLNDHDALVLRFVPSTFEI